MSDQEQWRPIPGFEGCYEISSRGRVRGVHRTIIRRNNSPYTVQPRILRARRHTCGLLEVGLVRRGQRRWLCVHHLVADVFGEERSAA